MGKNIVTANFKLSESRHYNKVFYVSKVKGDGGVDWEWTPDPKQAAVVSFYWARRFMADRRACGSKTAAAIEVE